MNIDRLNALADLLDTVDGKHRDNGEPAYCQGVYRHACGTPACALGHWAAANPKRWVKGEYFPTLKAQMLDENERYGIGAASIEFDISIDEAEMIFKSDGCDNAQTGGAAAAYIREFIRVQS